MNKTANSATHWPELPEAQQAKMRVKARHRIATVSEAYGDMSDEWIANRVRMLGREDLEFEPICTAARDRLMRLSLGLARAQKTSTALQDVIAERQRQVSEENYTPEHDDEHDELELLRGAQCYLDHAVERQWMLHAFQKDGLQRYQMEPSPEVWPWAEIWWKPKNPRRDLVRTAALIVAEIERLDRLDRKEAAPK